MAVMNRIKGELDQLSRYIEGKTALGGATDAQNWETIEFTYISLIQQHELVSLIICHAIDKHVAVEADFTDFLRDFRRTPQYNALTVHHIPILGAYITMFGSTEGSGNVEQARKLNQVICQQSEDDSGLNPLINAFVKVWWIAEYSGWYMEDAAGSGLPDIDLDEEDKQRSKQFIEALKDGAFDFMVNMLADVRTSEWRDSARPSTHHWLPRRTPPLPHDTVPFSLSLQNYLVSKTETFVDAFISNMPDVLRKLKIEEDEQRQTGQNHEQDLDLERFLLIIAYTYEGRPEAADAFWADPENNMAGFLQWSSRRVTTPLQTAFCEMLQSLADDEESATSAHEFLLDEGHQMRRPASITWFHILKECDFDIMKIREKPIAGQASSQRTGKFNTEQAEMEPESSALLVSYLRLIAKLAARSETARMYLLSFPNEKMVDLLFQAISSFVEPRVRAQAFKALGSFLSRKTLSQNFAMWSRLEACLTGHFLSESTKNRMMAAAPPSLQPLHSSYIMEQLFQEISIHIDDAGPFLQLLVALVTLPEGYEPLNDVLPFSDDLGASNRARPGIEPYIDFTLGHMFSTRIQNAEEIAIQRILRFYCLDFAVTCISTFNEDLIVFGNESNVAVDSAIHVRDLETYITLHPFAWVMEWMYDSKFMKTLLGVLHQNPGDIGKAAPDSPLILSILRAVELLSRALDLQATYQNLVRPMVKPHNRAKSRSPFTPASNCVFASIEDGLMTSMTLVSDLGGYCGLGHPDLTVASLKLLEKISTSQRIISAWQPGSSHHAHRNKAIVALEENGDAGAISGAFSAEFSVPLDFNKRDEAPEYQIKVYILDFILSCLRSNPDRPTIAHLLLGFQCTATTLDIEDGGLFVNGASLFHKLLPLVLEVPISNEEGIMQGWLISLKYKAMRILKILWSSQLSASLVLDELRENDFLFHILLQGLITQQGLIWDGQEAKGPDFLVTPAAQGYVDYLSVRAMALEYIARELCGVSRGQTPALKRRVFDALGGQIKLDEAESVPVPSVFEFQDSLPQDSLFATSPPELKNYGDLDLRPCLQEDDDGHPIYNLDKVQALVSLKRKEDGKSDQLILPQEAAIVDAEGETLSLYVVYLNRLTQVKSYSLKVLQAWTRLLMVMTDTNDFQGTAKVSFILQTLQAILPGLESYGSENPEAAYELAKLAKVLLYKLDFTTMMSTDTQNRAVETLVSEKLFQLLQVCLSSIAKWVGNQELRAIYYSICYRHLTGLLDHGRGVLTGLRKTLKTIQMWGDKLLNVVCDDAFGGDAECQSAALILLGTLIQLGKQENDSYVVEALNKLNFIGILVDSLRDVLQEWEQTSRPGNPDQHFYLNAKLSLLLQLCQTHAGAKYTLQANLFRVIEQSGLFAVDPELQVNSSDPTALEKHYALLVKVARIIGVAIVSRGSHNVAQGRRFLTEHRMLVMHVLKRSAGIGAGAGKMDLALAERIDELAEAFMVLITASGFIESEGEALMDDHKQSPALFH
ncbi:nucleoporin Nup186/Nup192/Nup205 [Xylariomycetidae sp. FL0641]|nr:nucleoporin Nup186/Nup192/Nup205 [Xylariomycetidae sp. FL0641]